MRKIKHKSCLYTIVALLTVALLFSGCVAEAPPTSSDSVPKTVHGDTVVTQTDGITSASLSKEIDLQESIPLLVDHNRLICYKETARSLVSENEAVDYEYFVVDLNSMEWRSVGKINYVLMGSGESLVAPDGNFYVTQKTAERLVTLYRIDLESGGITPVYESTSSLPFQYLSVLDKENLLIFEPDEVENAYYYRVKLYNLVSEEVTLLLEKSAEKGKVATDKISSAFAYEGEIYCLMRAQLEYRIDVLNTDGSLNRTVPLDSDSLRDAATLGGTEHGVIRMYVFEGVAWFKTLASSVVPFSLEDGSRCGDNLLGYAIIPNLSRPEQRVLLFRVGEASVYRTVELNGMVKIEKIALSEFGKKDHLSNVLISDNGNEFMAIIWENQRPENQKSVLFEIKEAS